MRRLLPLGVVLLAAVALAAHDTWLVPTAFRVKPGQAVAVALNTSEDFPASEAAPAPDRIARFALITDSGQTDVTGYRVEGKSLVAEVTPGSGLTLVAAVTHPRLIVLEPEEFNTYITEERLETIVAARAARGQTQTEGRERYSKVAKLVLCEESRGQLPLPPHPTFGLPLEIVPLASACGLEAGDKLPVRILFRGRPLANVWVVAGSKGTRGHHYPFWERTDAEGRVVVRLPRSGPWFVRVLHMVPSTEFSDADWQSWFSTLTFAVE